MFAKSHEIADAKKGVDTAKITRLEDENEVISA